MGTAGVSLAYPCYAEPRWLEATQTHVRLPRNASTGPVRLLQLSDLHASRWVSIGMIAHAVRLAVAQMPDIICLTGDYVTVGDDFDSTGYAPTLRALHACAPTFAVLGNHDGGRWAGPRGGYKDHRVVEKILEDSEIELLHNRSVHIPVRGRSVTLIGVGDFWSDEIDAARAFADVHPGGTNILLSHNPDSKQMLDGWRWELMLSGHTHGGQVVLPFLGPRFAPVEDKRYVAGLKPWKDRQIHVTRGVGNLHGVRFRCRPEVSLLVLE
jgi:predicted MPP superfamily phosphohydrolase